MDVNPSYMKKRQRLSDVLKVAPVHIRAPESETELEIRNEGRVETEET